MPRDVNGNGDIFGGWLVTQMDLAGTISAQKRAQGRVATVAIDSMVFLRPIKVGDIVACYTDIIEIGRSSIKISIEAWEMSDPENAPRKLTEGLFTFVAINAQGRTRPLP
ncbi:acyl-CoA thioesterase [Amnimonas aquatica]|uniref:Acyl-CoA thioesterase n=1 Tax=Amnimonas aquatica TaxID=2094561 RepID=A0A2P6ASL1_9GAMM|nr:acyl-CoA thioesterase [Amnimonas aquatica]PQA42766.1 acyl-CoA thioesterase [Amnimonas aquatica]